MQDKEEVSINNGTDWADYVVRLRGGFTGMNDYVESKAQNEGVSIPGRYQITCDLDVQNWSIDRAILLKLLSLDNDTMDALWPAYQEAYVRGWNRLADADWACAQ